MSRSLATRFRRCFAEAFGIALELAAHVLNGTRVKVSTYLMRRGMPADFVAQYASAFGRAAAKEYRAAHGGSEPEAGWTVRNGKLRRVNVYRSVEALEAAFCTYRRTRRSAWVLAA